MIILHSIFYHQAPKNFNSLNIFISSKEQKNFKNNNQRAKKDTRGSEFFLFYGAKEWSNLGHVT